MGFTWYAGWTEMQVESLTREGTLFVSMLYLKSWAPARTQFVLKVAKGKHRSIVHMIVVPVDRMAPAVKFSGVCSCGMCV